jgi:hypothetical protein
MLCRPALASDQDAAETLLCLESTITLPPNQKDKEKLKRLNRREQKLKVKRWRMMRVEHIVKELEQAVQGLQKAVQALLKQEEEDE